MVTMSSISRLPKRVKSSTAKNVSSLISDAMGSCRAYSNVERPVVHLARGKGIQTDSSNDSPGGSSKASKHQIGSDFPVVPGKVSPRNEVPAHILRPSYAETGAPPQTKPVAVLHSEEGIKKMREAGRITGDILDFAGSLVEPGRTTDEIDRLLHERVVKQNYYPSPFNYMGYPKSCCTSINEIICHGIPDSRPLQDGDIVNIDVSVFVNGYHGDTSRTFFVGDVSDRARRLVDTTEEALRVAIGVCGPGVPLKRIGAVIEDIADREGYSSVEQFCGHGIGQEFHMHPHIHHYRNNYPGIMLPGMTFTIEPMFCEGRKDHVIWQDGWTVATADGGLSAQFEHTLLVTDHGVDILT